MGTMADDSLAPAQENLLRQMALHPPRVINAGSGADSQIRRQQELWASPPAGMCRTEANEMAPYLRFMNRLGNPDGFPVDGVWFEQGPAPPAPLAAAAEVVAAGAAVAASEIEAEGPMLLVNIAPGDGPSQLPKDASEDDTAEHRQAQSICEKVMYAGSAMVDSPGLWEFLHEQGLQNGCFVCHIASNYWGPDRPSPGKGKLKKWLKALSFLDVYTDASNELCVRLAASSAAFCTAHCSSSVNELTPRAQECAASAGDSQQPQKTPGQRKRKRPATPRGSVAASLLGTAHPSSSNTGPSDLGHDAYVRRDWSEIESLE